MKTDEDESWDKLLASPKSKKVLKKMAEHAKEEYKKGKTKPFPIKK